MDLELKFYRLLMRALPPLPRVTGIANRILRPFYLRRPRKITAAIVHDFQMELDPQELIDANLLLCPGHYDRAERRFLEEHCKPGHVFADLGTYIGMYTLLAARIVGLQGLVVAVEADPVNFERMTNHVRKNHLDHIVRPVQAALSDAPGHATFYLNRDGRRSSSSVLFASSESLRVRSATLLQLLTDLQVPRLDGMKIDIEGMEYRVLKRYFSETDDSAWPSYVIVEYFEHQSGAAGGNVLGLLFEQGYRQVGRHAYNYFFLR